MSWKYSYNQSHPEQGSNAQYQYSMDLFKYINTSNSRCTQSSDISNLNTNRRPQAQFARSVTSTKMEDKNSPFTPSNTSTYGSYATAFAPDTNPEGDEIIQKLAAFHLKSIAETKSPEPANSSMSPSVSSQFELQNRPTGSVSYETEKAYDRKKIRKEMRRRFEIEFEDDQKEFEKEPGWWPKN